MIAKSWMHRPYSHGVMEEFRAQEALRKALRREMARSGAGVEELAAEVGCAPNTLRGFLAGRAPYGRVRASLREWAEDRAPEQPEGGAVVFTAAAEVFPAEHGREVRRWLSDRLAELYVEARREVPGWVEEGRTR